MKNKKGFTLVELLAVIIILGILSGIGIVAVGKIINNSKKQYYKTLKSTIKNAAASYFADHRALLPTEKNESNSVTVDDLIYFKYLKDNIQNTSKEDCNKEESKVVVTRLSLDNYKYEVILKCPNVANDLINSE